MAYVRLFEDLGFLVDAVPDGTSALEYLIQSKPDIVIADDEDDGTTSGDAMPIALPHTRGRLAVEPGAERLALDERHREPEMPVGLTGVVDPDDVCVLERCDELDLAVESLGADRVAEVRVQDLYRDVAIVPDVMGDIHGCHAARPQLAPDRVASLQCGSEAIGGVQSRDS